jgi:hypothetical protein
MGHKWRVTPHGSKRPDRRINATRKKFFSALLQLTGAAMGKRHLSQYKRPKTALDFRGLILILLD